MALNNISEALEFLNSSTAGTKETYCNHPHFFPASDTLEHYFC